MFFTDVTCVIFLFGYLPKTVTYLLETLYYFVSGENNLAMFCHIQWKLLKIIGEYSRSTSKHYKDIYFILRERKNKINYHKRLLFFI